MRYFGLFTFGLGFLGCGYFIALGVLHIVAPAKVPGLSRPFLTRKQQQQLADSIPNAKTLANAIVGCGCIAFAVLFLVALIRSLLYHP